MLAGHIVQVMKIRFVLILTKNTITIMSVVWLAVQELLTLSLGLERQDSMNVKENRLQKVLSQKIFSVLWYF